MEIPGTWKSGDSGSPGKSMETAWTGMVLTPSHEKWGRYDRNPWTGSWESRIGVFSSLKRRGGVPPGAAQFIIIAGLAYPEITEIVQFLREIHA